MNQGTIPFVYRHLPGLLVCLAVMLISACASDEPEHVATPVQTPEPPQQTIQAREWYPTPRIQQGPYYGFDTMQGQMMQQVPAGAVPQYGQGYGSGGQAWQPAAPQYPATGGWGGYNDTRQQAAPPQQGYYPTYPAAPQQPVQAMPQYAPPPASAPQYQPYYSQQPQYPAAQRPWGVPGSAPSGTPGRQSIETWQVPGQYPGWTPPTYNGAAGQPGAPAYPTAPVYYW